MNAGVRKEVLARGVSRLCHFTRASNLEGILEQQAVLDRSTLDQGKLSFHASDPHRFDDQRCLISCSIEYPNAWYFAKARDGDRLFGGWVVLLFNTSYLWRVGALFCRDNAARHRGQDCRAGADGFQALFHRSYGHRVPAAPCNLQAEALVPGPLSVRDMLGLVVRDETQAKRVYLRCSVAHDIDHTPIWVAPAWFTPRVLEAALAKGTRPDARRWEPSAQLVASRPTPEPGDALPF